jgi:glycosyltransferase involved in cell wall biosynthesis
VRLVADGENRGLVARLNQIAQLARFPYVCRMDGDDLSHPERLASQVAYLEAHRDVDVLDTMAISIDIQDRPSRLRASELETVRDPRMLLRARGGALIHASVMARVEWVRRFPYDPEFVRAEDQELWIRSCASSRFEHLRRSLYFIREDGSVSLANYRRSCATSRKIMRRYGPGLVGPLSTRALVVQYHAKELCYRVFAAFGQTGRLVARRGTPLEPEQLAQAHETIATILRTPVPGIDEEGAA